MLKWSIGICFAAFVIYQVAAHHNSFLGSILGGGYGGGYGGVNVGYGFGIQTNKSVLCALKGGTCITTTTSCVGVLKFNCENLQLCCFNTTQAVIIKTISYGGGYGRRRGRGYGGFSRRRSYGWKK